MDKIKRNERLGALTRILTETPNRIHTLGEFCELFGAAKSTISEDIDLVSASFERFDLGRVETVAGADLRACLDTPVTITVTKEGKIVAKGVGTCTIYVIANNGGRATVKVTVVKKKE